MHSDTQSKHFSLSAKEKRFCGGGVFDRLLNMVEQCLKVFQETRFHDTIYSQFAWDVQLQLNMLHCAF